jgi:hypothetical protein
VRLPFDKQEDLQGKKSVQLVHAAGQLAKNGMQP